MDKWFIIHEYRREAAKGTVDPLLCPLCDAPLFPVINKDEEPDLQCWTCKTNFPLDDSVFMKMVDTLDLVW